MIDIGKLKSELERLFSAQGKSLDFERDTITFFTSQIMQWPYPEGAIIAGIKSLFLENLKNISLGRIRDAVSIRMAAPEESERIYPCDHCAGTGYVGFHMVDKPHYSASLRCTCPNGQKQKNQIFVPWNGSNTQRLRIGVLAPVEGDFLIDSEYFKQPR